MRDIVLHTSLDNFSAFISRKRKKSFRAFAKKVLERDNYTCRFCGFQAKEYQEIINLDNNYQNNKARNMATACCFCTQCHFIESVGEGGYGGGTIIYLPEVPQPKLNALCHVLFCAMVNETTYKDSAQSIYRTLKMRSQAVEEQLGEGVSQPSAFGQLLIEYQANHENIDLEHVLSKLRLLPSRGRFKKQIETWAASAIAESPPAPELPE